MCESRPGPSSSGSVVIDIGGDVGALIIDAPAALEGVEIEVSTPGRPGRVHTEIRERLLPGGRTWAAVFAALEAGDYVLHGRGGVADRRIVIEGGAITHRSWIEAPAEAAAVPVG